MANTTPEEQQVIDVLKRFSWASRTNVSQNKLTNHDAAAIVFWMLGPCQRQQVIRLLNVWRTGNEDRKRVILNSWAVKNQGERPRAAYYYNIAFTYLFNDSGYGGYGFVAKSAMSRGNWMQYYYSVSKCDKAPTQAEINRVRAENRASRRDRGKDVFNRYGGFTFRRTYWYRQGKGIYAPTVECARRMRELGFS